MLFWIFMVLMTLLIPVVMVGCGWLFLHHPPKTINGFYGYRTKWSGKVRRRGYLPMPTAANFG